MVLWAEVCHLAFLSISSRLPDVLIYCLVLVWVAAEHSVEDHWGKKKNTVFKLLESAPASS